MDGTVANKITMSDTQVVSLASDGVLGNTNFVFSDGSSMLTTSDANLDDGATAYVTVPLQFLQDGSAIEAGSDLPNIILKNLASQTFLLDTSQLTLLPGNSSHQVILGSDDYNDEQEVNLSIQNAESERTSKKSQNGATVPSMGLDIAAIDLPGLDGGGDVLVDEIVTGDIDPPKPRITFNLVSAVSPSAREDTQPARRIPPLAAKPAKRGPGRPRREDAEVEPPIGKGPFKCDICSKEFTKWLHCKRHIKCHSEDKPFLCNQCSASFNVESNLMLHKATHNVEDPHCPECNKKFSRIASLKAHIMLHEKEESLFCSECGDEFSTMSQLEEHKKEHEDEWVKPAPPQCRQCKYQFSRASQLREHMKEHYKVKASLSHKSHKRNIDRSSFIHKCDICHKCFQKPSQLVRHKRIHTGERPFKCHLCSRAFNQKGSLQIHMSKHNGIKPFRCEFCAASFSQKGNLRAHIVRVHTIPQSGEQVYKCMECPCVFKKLGSLNAHMSRMHCGENSQKTLDADDIDQSQAVNVRAVLSQLAELEADLEGEKEKEKVSEHQNDADILQQALVNSGLSGKDPTNLSGIASELDVLIKKELKEHEATEFSTQSNQQKDNSVTSFITLADRSFDGTVRRYIIRQRRVGTIRWHQCSYCSKEFKKASDLVRHIRIHTRERPFKCTHCFRSFAVKSTLTAHIRTHTGVRDHVCYICMKKFSSASSLKVHIRMHTGSKPFSCQYCDKAFRTTGHMKAHMLSHTKDSSAEDRAARRKQAKQKSDISNLPDVPLQEPILITNNGLVQTVPRSTSVFLPGDSVSADRPYKCSVCNAAFRKSSHLKQHIRMHTGERPYKCNLCERRFISNGVLKAHMRTHEGVKSYKCPECNNLFSTNGSLKRHMGTHSDVRPFMCPYCHKTFKTSVNCRKHMKTHKHELALQVALQAAKESNSIATPVVTESTTIPPEGLGPDFTHAFSDQPFQVPTSSEHQDQEESAFAQSTLVHTLASSDLGESVNPVSNPGVITHTLHADASGTITLPALSGQHTLTQENIREIERTLNEQIFGASANSAADFADVAVASDELGAHTGVEVGAEGSETESTTTEDLARTLGASTSPPSQQEHVPKDKMAPDASTANNVFSTSFETTPFESCVFSTITLQTDPLELDALGPGTTITTNMASILPPPDAPTEEPDPITESVQPDANTDEAVVEGPVAAAVAVAGDTEENDKTYVPGRPFNANAPPGERPYKCKLCSRAFKKLYHLKEHARGHIGKTLGCTLCDKKCTTYTALRAHMKTHSGTKDYACDICGCRFTTNGSLKRHMIVHSEERPLKCCICNAMFRTDHLLRQHIKLHQPRERKGKLVATNPLPARGRRRAAFIQLTPEETKVLAQQPLDNAATVSEKVLIASAAEKDRISELKDPEAQYQMEPLHPNQCKYCPKSFRKPSDLVRHIRIHTGERPYQCSCCNKCFTVKSTLDSHVKTHGGQKLFACHVCGCLFSTKGSLKVHMRLHTGAKPFKCPLCELRFRTSGHRKAHLMSHMKQAAAGENRSVHLTRSSRRNKRMQMVLAAESNVTQEQQEQEQQQQDQQAENNNDVPEQLISHITIDQATFNSLIQPTSVAEGEAFSAALLTTAGTTNGSATTASADGQIVGNFQLQLGDSLQIAGVDSSGTLQLATAQTLQLDDALLQQFQASNIIIQAATSDDPLQQEQEQVMTNEPHPSTGEMTAVHFEIHTDEQGQIIGMTPLPEDDPTQTEEITFDLTGGLDMEVTECDPPQRLPSRFRVTDSRKGGPTLVAVESLQSRKQHRHDDVDDFIVTHDCTTCGKRFSKPSQLERHIRIHTGERPYACPVCSKTFNQNNTLNMHVKSHTGERPYPCPHCSYSSTQKGNLKTHMRRAHQFSSLELGTSSNASATRSILKRKQQQQTMLVSSPDSSGKSLDLEKVVGDLFPQMRNTTAADP